ncbi:ABC transporter ATP-binding protein [Bradyrhizobium sp.]|uniref:ABC transporter ATP-binding protein n=1 Tax=Bradyrhizobium sp. TaxID=376 RepID=UPI003C6BC567
MSDILQPACDGEDGALGRPVPSAVNADAARSGPENDPGAASSAIIDLRDITYTYEGEAAAVINGVSLRVEPGEFVLILGPSGCGKSTLLNVLNGTIPHTLRGELGGHAVVCGKSVPDTRVVDFATEVGMVFQDPEAQIINTRVRDEVCFGLENLCRPVDEIMARQAEALACVGLPDAGDLSIFDMSGGQKQRISIAAVLAARPRLLVLDEPTANLDPVGMAEVFAVLHRLNTEFKTTIVMVEHRVDELADRVSRVVMMDRGQVVFDGEPWAAFARHREAHSEEAETIAASAWFPQVSEFAVDLSAATGIALAPGAMPLNVAEAIAFAEDVMARGVVRTAAEAVPPLETTAPRKKLLAIRNLTFGYASDTPILKDLSLELETGSMVALLGPNGSGKTTLARALIGINPVQRGTVYLGDKDISDLGPREISAEVGYVFQNPDHQFVTDQIDDEVAYGMKVRGYADDAIARRVDEVLDIVDLARYRHRSPFNLSLGERRRLSVATMLVLEPHLLVLDEPTIGQDHERAQHLMRMMDRLRERYGTTILMITHDVRLVAEWADRVIALSGGGIAFDGTPEALFAQADLLKESALLPPPIFEVSAALAKTHPERIAGPTLSIPDLIRSMMT